MTKFIEKYKNNAKNTLVLRQDEQKHKDIENFLENVKNHRRTDTGQEVITKFIKKYQNDFKEDSF